MNLCFVKFCGIRFAGDLEGTFILTFYMLLIFQESFERRNAFCVTNRSYISKILQEANPDYVLSPRLGFMEQSVRNPFGRVLQLGKKAPRLQRHLSCYFPDRFAILGRFRNDVHREANDYGMLTNKNVNGGWVVSC